MGGSFMRGGSTLFNKMNTEAQDGIMTALFDQHDGAAFVLGKVPIGKVTVVLCLHL